MWRSIFGNFGVRVLSALLNLGLVILFSQVGGLIGKGEQSLLLTTVAILTIFDALIGGASLVNFSSKYAWRTLLTTSYIWIILMTAFAGLGFWLFSVFEPVYLGNVLMISILSAVVAVHTSLLLGQKRFFAYNFIQLSIPLITLLVCLFQYFLKGVLIYEIALYIAYGFAFLSSCYLVCKHYPKSNRVVEQFWFLFKKLLTYGTFNQLAHVFQLLSFRAAFYFLEFFHGKGTVGLYSNASSLSESVWLIATSISLWQYAVISNSDDRHYTIQLTQKLAAFGMTAAFFACLLLVLLPSSFYGFIFGSDFSSLHSIMWLLAPGCWIFSYALIVGHYFSGHGRYHINALASGFGLVISILGAFVLIPDFKAAGAAIAASLSYFVTSFVVFWYFHKDGGKVLFFPKKEDWKELQLQLFQLFRQNK